MSHSLRLSDLHKYVTSRHKTSLSFFIFTFGRLGGKGGLVHLSLKVKVLLMEKKGGLTGSGSAMRKLTEVKKFRVKILLHLYVTVVW